MFRRNRFKDAARARPPRIPRRWRSVTQHGRVRKDAFGWLRAPNWQEVLRDPAALPPEIRAALEAENAYYEKLTAPLAGLRETLVKEMRGRMKEDEASVPLPDGPWRYWVEYRTGGEYPIFKRAPREGGGAQTLFDGDAERGQSGFFNVGGVAHSPDHRLVAYAVDRIGSENYQIRVRDIDTGEEFPETIVNAAAHGAIWAATGDAYFYVERDEHQRTKRVRLHRLGADPATDPVIYEEPDDGFFLDVATSHSQAYIFITSRNHTTSEARFLPADDPDAPPRLIAPRQAGVEYDVEHRGEDFFILTNADDAIDFKIVRAPVSDPGRANWRDHVPHEPGRFIVSFTVYRDFMVRLERKEALPRIIVSADDGEHEIAFDEAAYALGMSDGFEFDTKTLRFSYESPSTPRQTYDYDMAARTRALLKTQEVPSGHDPKNYVVERIFARAADGAKVPVTILRRAETRANGTAPAVLYGYGSYGHSMPANFSTGALSLVDRGVVFAVAHVRGGADLGRRWYLEGKREKKLNTFSDFAAAARALTKKKYAARGEIVIYGGSAGGMLVGAAVNQRPDLFAGVIAAVPFVDVLNTVSDATLPLTPPEWEEWGNPVESAEEYDWIASYSPYDNIARRRYPPIMATAGLADYRVTYWEPAKWIARLRAEAKGGPFVLRINLDAGHAGAGARFERIEENAHLYAFALKALGRETAAPLPQ